MTRKFTLQYWLDDGWFVGKLREVPGVFSQGKTLAELEENICDAFKLIMEESDFRPPRKVRTKQVEVGV